MDPIPHAKCSAVTDGASPIVLDAPRSAAKPVNGFYRTGRRALSLFLLPLALHAAPNQYFGACGAEDADLNGVGLKITRMTLNWAVIQPTSGGGYNWNATDNDPKDAVVGALLDDAVARDVLLIAGAKWPAWTGSNPNSTDDNPTAAQVATFAKAAAQHYYGLRNKKIFMEIMNEPNGTLSGTATQKGTLYKDILHQSYTQIRGVLTSGQVAIVGVVLAGTPWMGNAPDVDDFWTAITTGTNPVQNNMDIISYHIYTIPPVGQPDVPPEVGSARTGPLLDKLTNSKTLINATGFSGAVWATEGGWPTLPGEKNDVSEAQQARWLVRMAVIGKGFGLNRFIMFRFQDTGNLYYGLRSGNGTNKDSYGAYKTMCGVLDSTISAVTKQFYDPDDVCKYKYTKSNGDYGYIVWSVREGSSGTIGLSVGTNGHLYKKTLDQPTTWTDLGVHSGTYNVTATPDPIYIEVR